VKHIDVCVCTCKRPQLLARLLQALAGQHTKDLFTYSISVADNDASESGRQVVEQFALRSAMQVRYSIEPRRNIALARNQSLAGTKGDYVAFIDDDEYPDANWLCALLQTCEANHADGVFGPVKPCFVQEPSRWVLEGGYFERPSHETGYRVGLSEARTGNALVRRKCLDGETGPFLEEFGLGGEDVDLFRRLMDQGSVFVWCDEAIVYEVVPQERCNRLYLIKRAVMRGSGSYRQKAGRLRAVLESMIAIPAYGLALPLSILAGEHYFMKSLLKACYYSGRLLASLNIEPVKDRNS
jgi:succinoglycan biosynthesis protein ExoM